MKSIAPVFLVAATAGSVDAFGVEVPQVARPLLPHTALYTASPTTTTSDGAFFEAMNDDSISSESSSTELKTEDILSVETIKALMKRPSKTVMSQSVPFLKCPDALIDCNYAGNVGFDPLHFAKNPETLASYRESEIKHGRLAMLAAVGWPLSEMFDRDVAGMLGLPPVLDATDRAPSLLNGGLEKISPVWWGFCLGLTAAIDLYGVSKSRAGDPDYFPGKLDFDPLNLYPDDPEGQAQRQLAEIKHGRLGMVAVVGYASSECVTKLGVVDETPLTNVLSALQQQ